jgi:GTP cyclohydrolase I
MNILRSVGLTASRIRGRIIDAGERCFVSDNISKFIEPGEKHELIEEATLAFERVLNQLVIDTENDPNTQGTAKRLAKMYINEILGGRYDPKPPATSFPNLGEHKYEGLLVVRAEIRSMCAHHFQPVRGIGYIGIIPNGKVIGLSKYVRIAQWCASRGTLQEELCNVIAKEVMADVGPNVGVYLAMRHGCMENRGVMAHSSLTQTTVLNGEFRKPDVKKEFMDNINLQEMNNH